MHSVTTRLAAGIALAMLASSSFAAEETAASNKAADSTAYAQGMRVYIDPETGARVGQPVTAEQRAQAKADAAQFSQDTHGLVQVYHADGSVSMDLQGRFEQAMTASANADGSRGVTCNDAAHAAQGAHSHDASGKAVAAAAQRNDR